MRNVLVLGAFGYSNNQLDGQTIKTRSVYNLIKKNYIGETIMFDTLDIKSKPYLYLHLLWKLTNINTLIFIPAENGIAFLLPILFFLSKIFRFSIVCVCVGGWQIEFFLGEYTGKSHIFQMKVCRKIKAFLPEMKSVNEKLINNFGFNNTEVFPNFRDFKILDKTNNSQKLKIVFMARIQKKKGYPAVFKLAEYIEETKINADITFFGQIKEEELDHFKYFLNRYKNTVSYGGELNPADIQKTLSNYDVLLLPTSYYTEGFPGSILDAYISGIPVIVTEWKHSHEFVDDGVTGFIVPFENGQQELNERIDELYSNRTKLSEMKKAAKKKSLEFCSDAAWSVLKKYL